MEEIYIDMYGLTG